MSPGDMEGRSGRVPDDSLLLQSHTGCTLNQTSQVCWPLPAQPRKALIFPLWTWIWTGDGEEECPLLWGLRYMKELGRDGAQVFPLAPLVF